MSIAAGDVVSVRVSPIQSDVELEARLRTFSGEGAHHEALLDVARYARGRAYAPYSRFSVGAALLGEGGAVWVGSNVENASYGLSICAERTALFAAVAAGARSFEAIAVAGPDGVATPPCGACRQVLAEFGRSVAVYYTVPGGAVVTDLLALLPGAFTFPA